MIFWFSLRVKIGTNIVHALSRTTGGSDGLVGELLKYGGEEWWTCFISFLKLFGMKKPYLSRRGMIFSDCSEAGMSWNQHSADRDVCHRTGPRSPGEG